MGARDLALIVHEVVPDDHLVRKIGALLDLSWVYPELAPYYFEIGRPLIDPVLMIRMLIIGYGSARSRHAHQPLATGILARECAMVAAIGSGDALSKGRDFAAWLGLVPKQISTGDRTVLGKISKHGNRYLRVLFVQAA